MTTNMTINIREYPMNSAEDKTVFCRNFTVLPHNFDKTKIEVVKTDGHDQVKSLYPFITNASALQKYESDGHDHLKLRRNSKQNPSLPFPSTISSQTKNPLNTTKSQHPTPPENYHAITQIPSKTMLVMSDGHDHQHDQVLCRKSSIIHEISWWS